MFVLLSDGAPPYLQYLTLVQVEGNDYPQPLVIPPPLVMKGEGRYPRFEHLEEYCHIQILGSPEKEPFQPLKLN